LLPSRVVFSSSSLPSTWPVDVAASAWLTLRMPLMSFRGLPCVGECMCQCEWRALAWAM
jgi:hypothetical protein